MRSICYKSTNKRLFFLVLFFSFNSIFCFAQNSLEDMNKKELRQLSDYLIIKSDSLQLRVNQLQEDNLKINSALSDSIVSIYKLNKTIETKDKIINAKESELIDLTNKLKYINDSLEIIRSSYNNLENNIVELKLESQRLKDSVINLRFKLELITQDKGENILIEEANRAENTEPVTENTNNKTQKYTGTYPYGKVTYSYFDDENGNRIYNGSFNYNTIENESYNWKNHFGLNDYQEVQGNPFCKGNYSLNKKTGSWIFGTITSYGKNDTIYAAYGNFKNDLPNGKFHYIYNNDDSKKKRIFDFYVNYVNGIPVGKVNFKCANNDNMRWEGNGEYSNIKSLEMTGDLSSEGEPSGEWIVKYQLETYSFQRKDTYLKGTLIRSELKNFATGEILFNQDFSKKYMTDPKSGIEYFSENFEENPYFIDKLLNFLNDANPSEELYENYSLNNIFPNSLIWMGKM